MRLVGLAPIDIFSLVLERDVENEASDPELWER